MRMDERGRGQGEGHNLWHAKFETFIRIPSEDITSINLEFRGGNFHWCLKQSGGRKCPGDVSSPERGRPKE